MALIAIGLEIHQQSPEADRLVKCAAKKLVAPDADPDTTGVDILPLTTRAVATHEEAQGMAGRLLDECAQQLGIADRRELVTVVR